jgi:large repetitive protein
VPPQTLTWSIASGPSGLTIGPGTGIINWTPAQTESPSTNLVTVAVQNNGSPALSANTSFNIVVYEVNIAPVLPVVPTQTVNALALLTVPDTATEPNIHATTVGYGLSAPTGASINSSGIVSWTPARSQGPSTNTFMVVATNADFFDVTNTYLETTNSFTVIVYAPTLAAIPNYTVNPGQTVSFTALATDNDPTRTLSFSVTGGPGSIGASSGMFTWRPPVSSAGSSTNVQVTVTDNSGPPLGDSKSFSITVNGLAPVVLTPLAYTNGQFTMQISGTTGPDYIIETSPNLVSWSGLFTNSSPSTPFQFSDPAAGNWGQQFYRVQLAP